MTVCSLAGHMTMLGVSLKTATRIDMKNWFKAIGVVLFLIALFAGIILLSIHFPIIISTICVCVLLVWFTYTIKTGLDKK